MVRLPLPIVMVGVLVALAAKVMLVRPPPGILALTEAMSSGLELENKGDRETLTLLGLLASKKLLLAVPQLSPLEKELLEEEVRMLPVLLAVEVPEKIQRVWLALSWLG